VTSSHLKRIRSLCLVVIFVLSGSLGWNGCVTGSPRILAGDKNRISGQDLAAALSSNPIAAGENVHVSLLRKTDHASVHLVQVRWAEKPHIHESHDMIVLVVRGHGDMTIGRETRVIREGDVIDVPAGTRHFFTNRGRSPAVAVVVFSPPFDGKDIEPVE
jgi:mannose-6-phosphate isomerase-like protein (cupin superfamily)